MDLEQYSTEQLVIHIKDLEEQIAYLKQENSKLWEVYTEESKKHGLPAMNGIWKCNNTSYLVQSLVTDRPKEE